MENENQIIEWTLDVSNQEQQSTIETNNHIKTSSTSILNSNTVSTI